MNCSLLFCFHTQSEHVLRICSFAPFPSERRLRGITLGQQQAGHEQFGCDMYRCSYTAENQKVRNCAAVRTYKHNEVKNKKNTTKT